MGRLPRGRRRKEPLGGGVARGPAEAAADSSQQKIQTRGNKNSSTRVRILGDTSYDAHLASAPTWQKSRNVHRYSINEIYMTQLHLSYRQARWTEYLADYNVDIKHLKGKGNVVADALSRRPDSNNIIAGGFFFFGENRLQPKRRQ